MSVALADHVGTDDHGVLFELCSRHVASRRMILSPEIVKQIKGHRRTMVRLPRTFRGAPVRPNNAYRVKTSQKAEPSCEITIESVEDAIFDSKPVWVIRFKLGNHTDEDRYPAARAGGTGGDYTSIPSRKLNGTGAEVSAHELSRFALDGRERHQARMKLGLDEWREATAKLRKMAPTAQQRKRLDSIAHQIAAIERENGVSSPQPAPPMPTRIAHGRP